MAKRIISTQAAVELMFNFIENNLSGIDGLQREDEQNGSVFRGQRDGVDVVLRALSEPIKPADSYIDEVAQNSRNGMYSGIVLLRSTSEYDGVFLRQPVWIDPDTGKNWYHTNKAKLTALEQKIADKLGFMVAYYNPSKDSIQVVRLIRYRQMPKQLQFPKGTIIAELPKDVRQQIHKYQGLRDSTRKKAISTTIDGAFTLQPYERQRKKLARIVPYAA